MWYKSFIFSLLLANLSTLAMNQTHLSRLPQALQDKIEAERFIDELRNAKRSEPTRAFSNIVAFFQLYPQFAKDQSFVYLVLNIAYKNFGKFEIPRLVNLLTGISVQPASQWLLDHGLSEAALWEKKEQVEQLVKQGGQVNDPLLGKTPLVSAAKRTDVMEYLLSQGADVKGSDEFGRTALHIAASEPNLEGVKLLLKNKANPNQKDQFGRTPLDAAVSAIRNSRDYSTENLSELINKIKEIIASLLAAGSDINNRDNYKKTALGYAHDLLKEGKKDRKPAFIMVAEPIIEFLKSKGAVQ